LNSNSKTKLRRTKKAKRNLITSESLIWHRTTETERRLLELLSEITLPPPELLHTLPLPSPLAFELCLDTDLPLLSDDDEDDDAPEPEPPAGPASELLEPERPRSPEWKNSMARSSRLISGNPEPLTVFTNFPLGAGTPSSKSSLPGTGIRCENRLRLRERRWAELLLDDPESSADDDEAPIGVLFVVDLNADVAIWVQNQPPNDTNIYIHIY